MNTPVERFVLEREVGRGACSIVHRARDTETGKPAAFKRLHFHDPDLFQRFLLEAEALASLAHPNIVRYVAHGVDAENMPWVAMEWLEGEDLERRLERGPVSPEIAIDWARQAAAALAAAHARKLIHRDVKPSNLFLVGDEVKILDFGIARVEGARTTETGRMIGTPAYIAPEQARGERGLDARVDVYSLGLTLWEMLTGYSPFKTSSRVATLARIVTTGVPRLRSARADAPSWLDDLVARATAFDATERFSTMLDFEAALAQASLMAHTAATARTDISIPPPPMRSSFPRTISDRILTVLVAGRFASDAAELAAARVVLAEGGVTVPLRGGRLLAHLGADRTHGDEVLRAYRCAERLVADHGVRVAIATGKGRQVGRRLEGAVAQAAAELFDASVAPPPPDRAAGEPATRRSSGNDKHISLDAPTRQLLRGARGEDEIPLFGRAAELATILGAIERAHEDGLSAFVLVTGPSGIGKSRLLREVEVHERQRGLSLLLVARAEPMQQAQGLGMCLELLRAAIGAPVGGEPAAAWDALRRWAAESAPGLLEEDLAPLGYLLGAVRDDHPSLVAMRDDPRAIRDATWLAATHLVQRAATKRRVLVMADDLDWCDDASADLLAHWVRRLPDQPVAVVAFARPEIVARRPALVDGLESTHVVLKPLARKAARDLARAANSALTDEAVERIVGEAHGSPLFVRELARLGDDPGAAGSAGSITLEAAVQARFDALPARLANALSLGAVLGGRLWGGALSALGVTESEGAIDDLCERGVAVPRATSRFVGEREREVRHRLWVEVALRSLDPDSIAAASLSAGRWLRQHGEDPAVVGEHLARGGAGEEAACELELAAEGAARAGAVSTAQQLAFRAVDLGDPEHAPRRLLLGVRQGKTSAADQETLRARARSLSDRAPDDAAGRAARAAAGGVLFLLGETDADHVASMKSVAKRAAELGEDATAIWALKQASFALSVTGHQAEAEALANEVAGLARIEDPALVMDIAHVRGILLLNGGRPAESVAELERSFDLARLARRPSVAVEHGCDYAYALLVAGDGAESWRALERVAEIARDTGADLDQVLQNAIEHEMFFGPDAGHGALASAAFSRARMVREDESGRYALCLRINLLSFSAAWPDDRRALTTEEILVRAEPLARTVRQAGFWELSAETDLALALALLRKGRAAEAVERARAGLDAARKLDLRIYEIHAWLVLFDAAAAAGEGTLAEEARSAARALVASEKKRRAGSPYEALFEDRFAMCRRVRELGPGAA